MSTLGAYCKAYYVLDLKKFPGWEKHARNIKKEMQESGADAPSEAQRELRDDDYLFLQENLLVTDGIFKDENIIFQEVTPEWEDFCRKELQFRVSGQFSDETSEKSS